MSLLLNDNLPDPFEQIDKERAEIEALRAEVQSLRKMVYYCVETVTLLARAENNRAGSLRDSVSERQTP